MVASTEVDEHTVRITAHVAIHMNNALVHMCIMVDPLPSGEILRAVFIGMIYLKVR